MWCECEEGHMTEEQQNLLSLLAHALFDEPTTVTITDEIKAEAQVQAVSSLIMTDNKVLATNIRVFNIHAQLTEILTGIPFTTFKGYASAYYYPKPSYRPMGDVDFIIPLEYYEEAVKRLIEAGYVERDTTHERHKAFRKDRVEVELHSEIKGIPNGKDGIATVSETAEEKVRELLSDLISTAVTVDTQQGPVIIPDDFHHGLIMLLHVAGHMINDGGVGLRHLCDWAVYVSRVDVGKYKEKLEDVGLWTFACQLTAVSTRCLGLPKQTWAGDWSDDFLTALIEDILAAGNFGRKEAGRNATARMQWTSFSEMTRRHYPQANTITLPVYMIVYVIRYGILMLRGKRRFIKPSTVLGAKGRNELYQKFRLFET